MQNWRPIDPDMYEDVQTRWQYANKHLNKSGKWRLERMWRASRDSARTPMQWSDEENAGFTTGTPWFYINDNYKLVNVADQEENPDSLLNFYRKAIELRKSLKVVRYGEYKEYFPWDGKRYVYSRSMEGQKILVICSFSDKLLPLKAPKDFDLLLAERILCNYNGPAGSVLRPYEARVYLWE